MADSPTILPPSTLPDPDRRRVGRMRARALADTRDPTPILLEFESPTAALLAQPVPLRSRYTTWVIATLFFVLLAMGWTIPIDRVVTTSGKVVPTANNIVVQPFTASIVRAIDVSEGQFVHKGDVLAQLDPTIADADAGALETQVASLQAEVDRLQAEQDGTLYHSDGTGPSQLQALIFAQRHAETTYKTESYRQKIDSLQAKVQQAQSDVASYTERLALAQTLENKRRELQQLQVGSQINTLAAQDSRVEMARSLAGAKAALAGSQRDLDGMTAQRDADLQQERNDTSKQLTDQGRLLQQARQDLRKARLQRSLVQLVADRDAIVLSIAPISVGSEMQSGDQFITMVPADSPLEIETVVDGRDAGFVHVGDPVTIKFETFPYTLYGTADGLVRVVSPDSFHRPMDDKDQTATKPRAEQANGVLFYRARISIDQMRLHDLPSGFRVRPGMPVTADVRIGKRTVVQYLFSRFLPIAAEGMREP